MRGLNPLNHLERLKTRKGDTIEPSAGNNRGSGYSND